MNSARRPSVNAAASPRGPAVLLRLAHRPVPLPEDLDSLRVTASGSRSHRDRHAPAWPGKPTDYAGASDAPRLSRVSAKPPSRRRSPPPRPSHRISVATFALLALLGLLTSSPPLHAQDDPKPDPIEKKLTITIEPEKKPDAPTAPPLRVVELSGDAASGPDPDWQAAYRTAPGAALTPAAQTTLRVALDGSLGRAGAVTQLKNGGEATRGLIRKLDVGRHDLLKTLYARAVTLANAELAAKSKSPLKKVLTVNSGGTGDYTRDQDITAFAGDEVTEKAFFAGLEQAARELKLKVDLKETGGIDFPEIEVTVFPGGNDLPDSRFGTDMGEFQLRYVKGIHKQLADLEAYIGGGADLEVKGRRRPGQIHVQEFTVNDQGAIHYRSEVPGNGRETRSLFDGTARERPEAWQKASHIFNDLLQGYRHSLHGDDPTKGPLKYGGRAIEYLCSIRGKKPWKDLQPDERRVLLRSLFPGSKVPDSLLERMEKVVDVADYVKREKKLPPGASPDLDQKVALIFLKKAVAASAGEMARQMLNPPSFEEGWLSPEERTRWDAMTPAERHEEALKRDKVYRENFSNEAFENLIVTLAMLRRIDIEEAKRGNAFHGEEAIRQIIETADPKVKPILEDASEYARLYMELHVAATPEHREHTRAELAEARKKLAAHQDGDDAPGKKLLDEMERVGARRYLKAELENRRAMPAAADEIRQRFDEHLKQAFPTVAEEWKGFKAEVEARGAKGYVLAKLQREAFQLDTIADALTLIEMYQRGASLKDYGWFLTTNVLSRVHWSFSHLVQAIQTRSVEDLELLGKNLVFTTLARIVPWAGTAKMVFDVAKGTVMVTVGYSINVVNADLVDALYTGEAGRTRDDAAGTVGGKIRDSGFCVLEPGHVLWFVDEKTKERTRAIDAPEVYRHFARKWLGDDPEALPEIGVREGPFAKPHDDLVRILERQAENFDRTWVSSAAKKRVVLTLSGDEVEVALRAFQEALAPLAKAEADRVMTESAVRTYKSYFDREDVIARGLAERLASDVLMGLMSFWETWLTAQVLAMRELERTATQADCAAYAKGLRDAVHDGIVNGKPGPKPDEFQYRLRAELYGKRAAGDDAFDGAEPVRVVADLEGRGKVGERTPEIALRVESKGVAILRKAGKQPEIVEPGDIVEQKLLVTAFADQGRGAALASTELVAVVRMPTSDAKKREIFVRRRTEKTQDGRVKESFSYIEPFRGMPKTWKEEDGVVYHGQRETFYYEGGRREALNYEFGVLDGMKEICDPKGRWVIHEPMKNGKTHGTRIHRDPDSQARLESDYENGDEIAERSFAENGQMLRKLSYVLERGSDGALSSVSGTIEAWWPSGQPRFHGAYKSTSVGAVYMSERGGREGETLPGRTGPWLWFHPNGQTERRATFVDGLYEGRVDSYDDQGRPTLTMNYLKGIANGASSEWDQGGGRVTTGSYVDGHRHGRFETAGTDGTAISWTVYDHGNYVDSGVYDKN